MQAILIKFILKMQAKMNSLQKLEKKNLNQCTYFLTMHINTREKIVK